MSHFFLLTFVIFSHASELFLDSKGNLEGLAQRYGTDLDIWKTTEWTAFTFWQ